MARVLGAEHIEDASKAIAENMKESSALMAGATDRLTGSIEKAAEASAGLQRRAIWLSWILVALGVLQFIGLFVGE